MKKFIVSIFILVMAGCATFKFSEEQWQAAVAEKVQEWKLEPVKRISAFRFSGWTALGEKHLIIRSTPFRPYLVELNRRCYGLDWAQTLGTKQSISSSLDAKFDSVFTSDEPRIQCHIQLIYPLTRDQEKALMALEREAEKNANAGTENSSD